ncbi:hypothetical protein I317_07493 [Kwoniella heveanensis CBS 569]|nr:hypothetical protein I317_07493 [Kwoniella heveanensis CBS 569]
MGVRDLLKWVKTNHPEAMITYPSRWASPELKGKRIAIDATLLTNRYHFASRDGPLKEKGEIIGWYNLISEMRAHGIKPVAIWDERGPREWKAPEARRRLTVRAGHLIRRNREIERSSRLRHLREVLHDFNAMSEEEKGIVRAHWEMTRFMFMRSKHDLEQEPHVEQIGLDHDSVLEESLPELAEAQSFTPEREAPMFTEEPTLASTAEISSTAGQGSSLSVPAAKGLSRSVKDVAMEVSDIALAPVLLGVLAVASAVLKTLPSHSTDRREPIPPPLPPKPESITGGPSKTSQLVSTLSEADDATVERITSMIDAIAPLVQEYRDARRPSGYKEELEPDEMSMILSDGVVEMAQDLREEWIVTPPSSSAPDSGQGADVKKDREGRVEEIDETLAGLVSPDSIRETPSQMALTDEEGKIINDILSPPASPKLPPEPTILSDTEGTPEQITSGPSSYLDPRAMEEDPSLPEPLERLDALIQAVPTVQGIYERALDIPSAADHEDCKELLLTMGVPVLEAKIPYEAEGLASALAKRGLVDYVGTEDSDVLAYEGPLLRHLSPATQPLSFVSGVKLRELTGLSQSAYLDFLILLGTDASPRIPKVGPVTALKLIKKHGSIEEILRDDKGVSERVIDLEGFMEMVNNARKVFTELPPTNEWEESSAAGSGDEGPSDRGLTNGLLAERSWDESEVERLLEDKHGIRLVEVQAPPSSIE